MLSGRGCDPKIVIFLAVKTMKTSRLVTAIICIVSSVAATKDLIVTWGGNRVSSQTQDPNYYEPSLEALCSKSNYASTVHIMGVLQFYGPNNKIGIGLANHCNRVYPGFVKPSSGYTLLSCPSIGAQIKKCQGLGKRVLISIGKLLCFLEYSMTCFCLSEFDISASHEE